MQYLSTINDSKIHKLNSNDTLWKQPPYNYSSNSNSSSGLTDDSINMTVEKNTDGKPPYSYATLIKYAIERSAENKLTLSQIYQWVIDHYPYYGTAGSGWKVVKKIRNRKKNQCVTLFFVSFFFRTLFAIIFL